MSEFPGISRLQEEQEKTLQNCESMIEKWEKFKEDYKAVGKLLVDLPKKTTHEVMVPIGPLAFMPGKLIHTNEIMVLLGDNWFAERSAQQAADITERRLKHVEDYLVILHKEHENILSHMAFTSDIANLKGESNFPEIKEELTEEDKQRLADGPRRIAHAKAAKASVKKVDLRLNASHNQTECEEDKKLFARLEELERLEQMNDEIEDEDSTDKTARSSSNNGELAAHGARKKAEAPCLPANSISARQDKFHQRIDAEQNEPCTVNGDVITERSKNICNPKACSVSEERGNSPDSYARVAQDERVQDGCSNAKGKNSCNENGQNVVKRVTWKENVVEEKEDKVAYPKEENSTIYFHHSTRTHNLPVPKNDECKANGKSAREKKRRRFKEK